MNYVSGTDIIISVDTLFNSVPYKADSAAFRVFGPGDALICDWTAVASTSILTGSILVTVPAIHNVMSASTILLEARVVEVNIVCASVFSGSQEAIQDYVITKDGSSLQVMVNSFQTYTDSIAIAATLSGELENWAAASKADRSAAMGIAFNLLSRMNFEIYYDYDDVYFRQRADWGLPYQQTVGRLYSYTAAQFAALDPDFILCICKAQIVEADVRLGSPNTLEKLREAGVIMEKTGEGVTQFRGGKPLEFMVSKKAMKYLGGYIKYSMRMSRS